QRGHGAILRRAPGRYTFEMLIADVLGLMDALDIAKAHFAGLSMGSRLSFGERSIARFRRNNCFSHVNSGAHVRGTIELGFPASKLENFNDFGSMTLHGIKALGALAGRKS